MTHPLGASFCIIDAYGYDVQIDKEDCPCLAMSACVVGCAYAIMFPDGIVSAYLAGLAIALSEFSR